MKYMFGTEIVCGKTTCKSDYIGEFCKYYDATSYSRPAQCRLFNNNLHFDDHGWTLRCEMCLKFVVETKEIYNLDVDCSDYKKTVEVADAILEDAKKSGLAAAGLAYDIPEHNRQDPPVYRKHMESVGLTVRMFGDYVYVFRDDGKVWEYNEIEWSYGASGTLMVNHTPIHRGIVPPGLGRKQE